MSSLNPKSSCAPISWNFYIPQWNNNYRSGSHCLGDLLLLLAESIVTCRDSAVKREKRLKRSRANSFFRHIFGCRSLYLWLSLLDVMGHALLNATLLSFRIRLDRLYCVTVEAPLLANGYWPQALFWTSFPLFKNKQGSHKYPVKRAFKNQVATLVGCLHFATILTFEILGPLAA